MDRLQTIDVFIAVADAQSFAGGARAMGLSAPSVTRGVNALEERLGAKLFHRTTRSVRLTEAGAAYLLECRRLSDELRAAEDVVSGARLRPTGRLRMTASAQFGQIYVVPVITAFLDAHPDVSVESLFLDRVVNLVDEGIDVAVRIGPLPDSGFTAVRVGQVRRVICASPKYLEAHGVPASPTDLATRSVVSATSGALGEVWRFKDGENVRVKPRFVVNTVAGAISAAKAGWGFAQLLSYQIEPEVAAGTLQNVLHTFEPEPLAVHLIYPDGRAAAAKVRAFVDLAKVHLRAQEIFSR